MQRAALAVILSCSPVLLGACSPFPTPRSGGEGSGGGFPIALEPGDGSDDSGDDTGDGAQGGGGSGEVGSTGTSETGDEMCARLDFPDFAALDEDEDGVDGTLCASVYVNPSVGVGGTGLTPADPVGSLAHAIEIAASYDPPRDVLVASGTLEESIKLRSGVSIYGGYAPSFASRDVPTPTVLIGAGPRTISAHGLDAPLKVQGFYIIGRDADVPGTSGYAVAIIDSVDAMVSFERCVIMAGDASDGAHGATGVDGENGKLGMHGESGGTGGESSCGHGGGAGADAMTCPIAVAVAGIGDAPGDAGSSAPSDCTGTVCTDDAAGGEHGGDGEDGVHGSGAGFTGAFGVLDHEGKWIVPPSTNATSGIAGSGGGGGGGAGFDLDGPTCGLVHVVDGGIGGGGGGAGCGGSAGGSGGPGGSSIAIAIVDADVELRMTTIVRGRAGNGGFGGDGGEGGQGAAGGTGRAGQGPGAEIAGDGGRGGDGGGGGGGAGGCAGSSIAIVRRGLGQLATQQLTIEGGSAGVPGEPGHGGTALGTAIANDPSTGAPGCQGLMIDELAQ